MHGNIESKNATTDDTLFKPTSPYGALKLSIQNYLYSCWKTFGLVSVLLRYFHVCGPRQSNNEYSGVIAILIGRLLKNLPVTIYVTDYR